MERRRVGGELHEAGDDGDVLTVVGEELKRMNRRPHKEM
jgi:hypothetical protein